VCASEQVNVEAGTPFDEYEGIVLIVTVRITLTLAVTNTLDAAAPLPTPIFLAPANIPDGSNSMLAVHQCTETLPIKSFPIHHHSFIILS
jgi:hypothetical protein